MNRLSCAGHAFRVPGRKESGLKEFSFSFFAGEKAYNLAFVPDSSPLRCLLCKTAGYLKSFFRHCVYFSGHQSRHRIRTYPNKPILHLLLAFWPIFLVQSSPTLVGMSSLSLLKSAENASQNPSKILIQIGSRKSSFLRLIFNLLPATWALIFSINYL